MATRQPWPIGATVNVLILSSQFCSILVNAFDGFENGEKEKEGVDFEVNQSDSIP